MNKERLLEILRSLVEHGTDPESDHAEADDALLRFINDPEVSAVFGSIRKWYA